MFSSAGLQLLLTDLGNVWILLLLLPLVRLSIRPACREDGLSQWQEVKLRNRAGIPAIRAGSEYAVLDQRGPPPSTLSFSGICLIFLTFHSFSFLLNSLPLSFFLSLSLSLSFISYHLPSSISIFLPLFSIPFSTSSLSPSLSSLPKTWQ